MVPGLQRVSGALRIVSPSRSARPLRPVLPACSSRQQTRGRSNPGPEITGVLSRSPRPVLRRCLGRRRVRTRSRALRGPRQVGSRWGPRRSWPGRGPGSRSRSAWAQPACAGPQGRARSAPWYVLRGRLQKILGFCPGLWNSGGGSLVWDRDTDWDFNGCTKLFSFACLSTPRGHGAKKYKCG